MTEEEIAAMQAENAAFKTQVEGLNASTTSMQNKMDQLLTETKQAKGAAKTASEEAQRIIDEKAVKDGDFEALYKSSEEKNASIQNEFNGLRETIATKDRSSLASQIAGQLAEGANAELLSTFIAPRLKSTEDGIKITDVNGGLTVLTADDLASEFRNSDRYASLIKGNQSSGGGASGGQNNGGAGKQTMTRSNFEALNPADKMGFVKGGGSTTDD
jgi:hypothetical protein